MHDEKLKPIPWFIKAYFILQNSCAHTSLENVGSDNTKLRKGIKPIPLSVETL